MTKRQHDIGVDHRKELDEVFVSDAYVHIERMSDRCFWMAVQPPHGSDLPGLLIFTGVQNGEWFFNMHEDVTDGRSFTVRRPAKYERKKSNE